MRDRRRRRAGAGTPHGYFQFTGSRPQPVPPHLVLDRKSWSSLGLRPLYFRVRAQMEPKGNPPEQA